MEKDEIKRKLEEMDQKLNYIIWLLHMYSRGPKPDPFDPKVMEDYRKYVEQHKKSYFKAL